MASKDLWFITPLQALASIGTAANFGGSVLQTPLIMPTLMQPKVPIQYSAAQIKYLVHESEKYFPPLNAVCLLSNIIVSVAAYRSRASNAEAAAKLPYALIGVVLNVATTAWALGVMVPMNQSMTRDAITLESSPNNEPTGKSLRSTLAKWQNLNLVRATFMISAAVVSMLGALQDGSIVKLRM